jgi:GT2 family glycosyltransferase
MDLGASGSLHPDYVIFDEKNISEWDIFEIQIARDRWFRSLSVPENKQISAVQTKSLVFLENYIRKVSRKIPYGSKLRKSISKFLLAQPRLVRNFIYKAVRQEIVSAGSDHHAKTILTNSFDLGLGLVTSSAPRVTILIPVHNNWSVTFRCLMALQRNFDTTHYEVILIDDASTDATVEFTRNLRGIRVLRIEKNVGFLHAVNLGAKFAKGEYLAILNNDTEPLSGWLDNLTTVLQSDKSIAVAGSKLIYPDGSLQEAGCQIFRLGNAWNLGRGSNAELPQYQFNREVDYCSAAAILVRHEFWTTIGGFDSHFAPAYCEDADLGLAAWENGYRVVYVPSSCVIHYEGLSNGTSTSTGVKRFQEINTKKMKIKWQMTLSSHWKDEGIPRLEFSRDSRGIIVVIDHILPSHHRDSGSLRTIRLCKLLQEAGWHVVLAAQFYDSSLQDIERLRMSGIEVYEDISELFSSLESRKKRVKLFWLIRDSVVSNYQAHCKMFSSDVHIISDLLDLKYYLDNDAKIAIDKKHLNIAKESDTTLLVSPYEVEILAEKHKGRMYSFWKYFDLNSCNAEWENREGLLFVGGFRHTPNVEGLNWFVDSVLPILRQNGFTSSIKIIGSGLDEANRTKWTAAGLTILGGVHSLDSFYDGSRISIIPLLSGRGMKGKVAESMSYGVPFVGTEVSIEGFDNGNLLNLMVTEANPKLYANKILEVYNSKALWSQLSDGSQQYVKDFLSRERLANKLEHILDAALGSKIPNV